jgi:hypothetical protein
MIRSGSGGAYGRETSSAWQFPLRHGILLQFDFQKDRRAPSSGKQQVGFPDAGNFHFRPSGQRTLKTQFGEILDPHRCGERLIVRGGMVQDVVQDPDQQDGYVIFCKYLEDAVFIQFRIIFERREELIRIHRNPILSTAGGPIPGWGRGRTSRRASVPPYSTAGALTRGEPACHTEKVRSLWSYSKTVFSRPRGI